MRFLRGTCSTVHLSERRVRSWAAAGDRGSRFDVPESRTGKGRAAALAPTTWPRGSMRINVSSPVYFAAACN